ncbi:MAG: PspC domain-containing protein [Candidatus Cryptobacteroides sp.]
MKKTINVAIGGCSFTMDEDAYNALDAYLESFKAALGTGSSCAEVMDELEARIADLFKSRLEGREVVDITITRNVIDQLGMPDGSSASSCRNESCDKGPEPVKKFFRDPDNGKIAGVCSGLSFFLGIDVVLVRILFLVALLCGSAGFWIYVVFWIAAPQANTAAEKCEMRGIPATAENIRKFTGTK